MVDIMSERPPLVTFETRAEEDRQASIAAGHYVGKNVDYVLVTPPGGNATFEGIAVEWLATKRQQGSPFYDKFQDYYDRWKRNEALPERGTPIKMWPVLSPAEIKQVVAAGCTTVEDLAQWPDGDLPKMGMGSVGYKKKAVAWLEAASSTGKLAEQLTAMRIADEAKTAQIANLTSALANLTQQLDAIQRGGLQASYTPEPGRQQWQDDDAAARRRSNPQIDQQDIEDGVAEASADIMDTLAADEPQRRPRGRPPKVA